MPAFAIYLLKVIICSAVLFGYYWFFLRNKIFHGYNRFYLLATVVLALALPMMKFEVLQKTDQPKTSVIQLLQVVNTSDAYLDEVILYSNRNHISKSQVLSIVYVSMSCFFFIIFLKALATIRNLVKRHPVTLIENISFISTTAKGTPFSFLQYIFWNEAIDINSKTGRQVFRHEVAHIQEKHSHDKLFMNIILIIFWSNPFFWIIRKELNMIHEFVADKKAIEDGDTEAFAAMILQATYPQHQFPLVNNFFYSPIKRRLTMLTVQHKAKVNYISRLFVLPLVLFVFAAFTFKAKKYIRQLPVNAPYIVVVDAGHGGKDNGAVGFEGIYEKDMCLNIAKKIKELNNAENIKIVLTRETDIYYNPQQKVALAKDANADLFISIHMDGAPANDPVKRSGLNIFVSNDEHANSEKSKLLASALLTGFQNNYGLPVATNPQQLQNKILVLQANSCPAVLIEAGYITTKSDFDYLKTDKAVETFATNVLNAIQLYLNQKEKQTGNTEIKTPINKALDEKDSSPGYKTILKQIEKDTYIDASQFVQLSSSIKPAVEKSIYTGFINEPLYIVNGRNTSKPDVNKINPDAIADIRVLKPTTAMPTYGSKAIHGAIIINTKPANATLGNRPFIIVDNKEYKGKTLQEVATLLGIINFEFEKVTVISKEEAVKKYGPYAKDGAFIATTNSTTFQPNLLSLSGISEAKIDIGKIPAINKLRYEMPGYTINSATVYFSGTGFPAVETVSLNNGSLSSCYQQLGRIVHGSVITFDNVRVTKEDGSGEMTIPGKSFSFYDRTKEDDKLFSTVEQEAEFPGGKDAWLAYLQKNLDADLPVKEGWKAGIYKIMVQFIVDKDGTVSDVKSDDYPNSKTAQQCINLIQNGPKWIPAKQNNKTVKAYKKQPVTFVVSEDK
ncbi:MAG: N-acetylmuramoyl-L-alanine amidase [Ferruginibacter sp.]|nr:N-acetylmuramoyl-L-alanine amidase [Ferruginibacter sp.]